MGVVETSFAALQAGSALVTNVPFIAPVAGLILQALQMRGVRFRLVSGFASGVENRVIIGSEAVQRRRGCCDGETRRHREHRYRCRTVILGARPRRRGPPRWCTQNIEVPSQVCLAYAHLGLAV